MATSASPTIASYPRPHRPRAKRLSQGAEKTAQDATFACASMRADPSTPASPRKRKNHTSKSSSTASRASIARRLEQSIPPAQSWPCLVTVSVVEARPLLLRKTSLPRCAFPSRSSNRVPSLNSLRRVPCLQRPRSKYDFIPPASSWTGLVRFSTGLGPAPLRATQAQPRARSLRAPVQPERPQKQSARVQNLILYGYPPSNEDEPCTARKPARKRATAHRRPEILERNFDESNSDSYREWMTQYMSATLAASATANASARIARRETRRLVHRHFTDSPSLPPARRRQIFAAHPRTRSRRRPPRNSPSVSIFSRRRLGYLSLSRSAATALAAKPGASASHANRLAPTPASSTCRSAVHRPARSDNDRSRLARAASHLATPSRIRAR